MQSHILEKVPEVRQWLAKNVDTGTLAFPDADATWDFITTRWQNITTNDAESLLGEAMKDIPEPVSYRPSI
jgi:hypothetical protein